MLGYAMVPNSSRHMNIASMSLALLASSGLASLAIGVTPPCDPVAVQLLPERGHLITYSKNLPIVAVFPTDVGIWYEIAFTESGTYYLEMHQPAWMAIRLRGVCAAVPATVPGERTVRFDVQIATREGVCYAGSGAVILPKTWEDPKPIYRTEIHHPIPSYVGPPLEEPMPQNAARSLQARRLESDRKILLDAAAGKQRLSAAEADQIGARMVAEPCAAAPPSYTPQPPPPSWCDVFG